MWGEESFVHLCHTNLRNCIHQYMCTILLSSCSLIFMNSSSLITQVLQGCFTRSRAILRAPRYPEPWFNLKMSSYQYRKSHRGEKTVVRSSYLHNWIFYTGKTTSWYWIIPLIVIPCLTTTKHDKGQTVWIFHKIHGISASISRWVPPQSIWSYCHHPIGNMNY